MMSSPFKTIPVQKVQSREDRRWSRLAFLGALYYLIVYALATKSEYNLQIVWLGAALLGLIMVPLFAQHVRLSSLPREGVLLGLFLLWSSTGYFVVEERYLFGRYLHLLAELSLIVVGISLILQHSGAAKWFYLSFLIVAIAAILSFGEPIAMSSLSAVDPMRAELESANAFGGASAIGVISALALLPEARRLWTRAALVAGGILAFYGVLLSASRTAFLALLVIAVCWPTLCLASTGRFKWTTLIVSGAVLLLAYSAYVYIIQETYMGERFSKSVNMEDNSTRVRFDLAITGLKIFVNNPLVGCGLGQFGVASGTGYYAHNEFVEIAATTGLPGLALYYSMYAVAWRRLSRSLRVIVDPLARYRVNIARVSLLILVITGLVSTPNFLSKPSMFLLATAVGIAHWAEGVARTAAMGIPLAVRPGPIPPGFPGWAGPFQPFAAGAANGLASGKCAWNGRTKE